MAQNNPNDDMGPRLFCKDCKWSRSFIIPGERRCINPEVNRYNGDWLASGKIRHARRCQYERDRISSHGCTCEARCFEARTL